MVRVVSVYVPSTVKEKKLFLEQLALALDTIGEEEELVIGGDFNCVEDNERDAVPKRSGGVKDNGVSEEASEEVRPVLTASRRAQLVAEERLMRELVEKHSLRDVFFSNDAKTYNTIYTNVTSNGDYNRRLDRIYITPRLFQSRLAFKHLPKFAFSTHHPVQLSIWISTVDTGKPLYKIRPNITNSSSNIDFVTAVQKLDLKDTNLKLDDFCLKVIQRAKSLSHYLNVIKDSNNSNNIKERSR
ncbi:unnamed protein product [Ambrosiozyma monospora]|uniref:Unnamed protein product n=1 Tax=Ambrosiozyma monospora TaxID=43982 RepID=A0A9W6T9E3_AMBMO|nr:unnamed protein product [Ambrosiozyma monospora]